MKSTQMPRSRTGSVYLVTLVTVGAIVSMVFIGLNMRLLLNSQTSVVTDMSTKNSNVIDAAELAMEQIVSDVKWKNSATKGIVYSDIDFGNTIFNSTVTDAVTSRIPDADTTSYRVHVQSASDQNWAGGQFDITRSEVDYARIVSDLGASNYWPLNEDPGSVRANNELKFLPGTYRKLDTAGQTINDEGALVPEFKNDIDPVAVAFSSDFTESNGTVSFWVNLDNVHKTEMLAMLGMLHSANSWPALNISVWQFGIAAYVSNDGSYSNRNFAYTDYGVIEPNTWHHIAVSWGAHGVRIYLDGVFVGHNAGNTQSPGTTLALLGGRQPLVIGGGYLVAGGSKDYEGFDGSIAHVALFNPLLDDTKVKELAAIRPDFSTYEIIDNSWVRVFNDD